MIPVLLKVLAADDAARQGSWLDQFPQLWDLLILLSGLALVGFMIWFMKGTQTLTGFIIHVDEADITFKGNFPPQMQATVIEFLRHDVALPGSYEIRGRWEGRLLIIAVKGDNARPVEQRIRNFMKLNIKPPR